MKKSIIALILLLFLTSCSFNSLPQEQEKSPEPISISQEKQIDISQTEQLELPEDAHILFFDEDVILFYTEELCDDGCSVDLTVYRYSIGDQGYETLAAIENVQYITGSVSRYNNEIYIPMVLDQDKSQVLSLNIDNKTCHVVSEWEGSTFICDTYTVDDQLIIFKIMATSDTRTDYEVSSLNLKDLTSKTIFDSYYENGNGTVISTITTDHKDLFLYSMDYKNNDRDIKILQYDLEHERITEIDIASEKIIREKSMTVTGLIKNNDYFIFETLEGDILIEDSNDTAQSPCFELEDVADGSYKIMNPKQYGPPFTNVAASDNQETSIYQFSSENHTLTPINLDFLKGNLNYYYTNTKGDILLQSNDVDTSKTEFYMIKEAVY